MNIISCTYYSVDKLISRLKQTTLLPTPQNPNPPLIFKQATMEVKNFPIRDMYPPQLYTSPEALERNTLLQEAFAKKHIDIFNLNGFYTFQTDDNENEFTLLPPILEEQKQKDGTMVTLIADGLHRAILARQQGKISVQAVVISNIPDEYAYPALPNSWEEIVYDQVPSDPAKKRHWTYPIAEAYSHYHYFGAAFPNSSKPRQTNS